MSESIDYQKLLAEALRKFAAQSRQKEELEAEIIKLRQFILATVNMLPDAERAMYQAELADIAAEIGGLTDAVREALKLATQRQVYFTAAEVRDHLLKAGFDFSQYRSNPLASVNTTIKRFKPSDVENITVDGVTAYRWILRFPTLKEKVKEERRSKVAAERLRPPRPDSGSKP